MREVRAYHVGVGKAEAGHPAFKSGTGWTAEFGKFLNRGPHALLVHVARGRLRNVFPREDGRNSGAMFALGRLYVDYAVGESAADTVVIACPGR